MFSLSAEARAELSSHKPGNSDQEVNTSSFTQSPAALQPTSLEQVQTLTTSLLPNQQVQMNMLQLVIDVSNVQGGGACLIAAGGGRGR